MIICADLFRNVACVRAIIVELPRFIWFKVTAQFHTSVMLMPVCVMFQMETTELI